MLRIVFLVILICIQANAALAAEPLKILDPRFDLSKAYWIVAAIAGVDPEDASIGSAAWANFVLDGDLVQELDSRETPADWPYGRMAIDSAEPNQLPKSRTVDSQKQYIVYELNAKLVDWAYGLTKNVKLMENVRILNG